MSKEVELIIEIDKQGNVVVTPKGTQGKECLDLMKFLDKIDGIEVKETTANEDMEKKNIKPALIVQNNIPRQ
jgi:uncharacterized membrane-anchored protein